MGMIPEATNGPFPPELRVSQCPGAYATVVWDARISPLPRRLHCTPAEHIPQIALAPAGNSSAKAPLWRGIFHAVI
jgi:hypothetical protein